MDRSKIMDEICLFKVGDVVTAVAQVALSDKKDRVVPQYMVVLERDANECYGGVQVHYTVRITVKEGFGRMGTVEKPYRFAEIELVPYPKEWLTPEPA